MDWQPCVGVGGILSIITGIMLGGTSGLCLIFVGYIVAAVLWGDMLDSRRK